MSSIKTSKGFSPIKFISEHPIYILLINPAFNQNERFFSSNILLTPSGLKFNFSNFISPFITPISNCSLVKPYNNSLMYFSI